MAMITRRKPDIKEDFIRSFLLMYIIATGIRIAGKDA